MKKIVLIFAVMCFAIPAAADGIKLATQPKGHRLSKESEPFVRCAMDMIGKPYTIFNLPWERAQRGTIDGTYDGFFIATRNEKRDAYAVFSETFYAIKWLYVVNKDSAIFPDQPEFASKRFAADQGSARLLWLKERFGKGEISEAVTVVDTPGQILKMLSANRIEVGLMNDHSFSSSIHDLSLDPQNFKTFLVRDTPAGVYFSKRFLTDNPEFMGIFNNAVLKCKKRLTP